MPDTFEQAFDIPRWLGFSGVPNDRTKRYSVASYRAQYMLLEHQAQRFHDESKTHQEVLKRIYQLLAKDPEYLARLKAGYPPHLDPIDQQEADALMEKLKKTSWSEVGKDLT